MQIVNRTGGSIAYELRGGPHRMTLSECELEAGEEEVWTPRYRVDVDCELIVTIGATVLRARVPAEASVRIEEAEDGPRIHVG